MGVIRYGYVLWLPADVNRAVRPALQQSASAQQAVLAGLATLYAQMALCRPQGMLTWGTPRAPSDLQPASEIHAVLGKHVIAPAHLGTAQPASSLTVYSAFAKHATVGQLGQASTSLWAGLSCSGIVILGTAACCVAGQRTAASAIATPSHHVAPCN